MDSAKKRSPQVFQKNISSYKKRPEEVTNVKNEDNIFLLEKEAIYIERENDKKYSKNFSVRKFMWIFLFGVFIVITSWFSYFSWKVYDTSKKIGSENTGSSPTAMQYVENIVSPIVSVNREPLDGESEGRINILLMGAAGKNKPGGNLTDTVMIASIDTNNKKVALLSLPRDFYVQIADMESYSKINSIYKIGLKEGTGVNLMKKTVENILDVPIQYYIIINYDGFEKVINDIGGINIENERNIYDTRYPGPNYSYETFELSKGFHRLDGATALKYVRERHDDPDGDFGRAKRQQQVIQAVKNKVFSAGTLLNVVALNNVLNTLGENVKTNISFEEIDGFITLSKELDMQNITSIVLDAWEKESLLKVSHIMFGDVRAFILIPRVGNYSEIQDLAQNIFDQNEIKKRKEKIVEENASIAIMNQSGDSQLPNKIRSLLKENLGIKNAEMIPNKDHKISDRTTVTSISLDEKIYTLDELIKKLPASLQQADDSASQDEPEVLKNSPEAANTPSINKDIMIILGKDLVDIYKYEEDSVEDFKKYQDSNEYDDMQNIFE